MKDFEFYQNLDLRYPELAICIGKTTSRYIAKFYIPILTPILDGTKPYDITDNHVYTSNIINNKNSMEILPCTTSNYLELIVPDNIEVEVGDTFVVIFVGGDPNKPVILGRYYNAINQ